jgi:hypothetical protein
MSTPAIQNCINTLRVVGDVDDSLSFRLKLQSLLSSTDFSIPGIPPSSLVFIRHLSDPRPGTLRLGRSDLNGARRWTDALRESLASKIRKAERPASGTVLDAAECVLFADTAEMLACLASDWQIGSLRTRWWWKTLLRAGDASEIVKQAWREHPQYVPAALDRLERQGNAALFVRALTDAECHQLLQGVVRSFAIQELAQACETGLSRRPAQAAAIAPPTAESRGRFEDNDGPYPAKPWSAKFETAHAGLSLEQERFLAIALMILRQPVYARSSDFVRALRRWQQTVNAFGRAISPTPVAAASPIAAPNRPERKPSSQTNIAKASANESPHASKEIPRSNVAVNQLTAAAHPARDVFQVERLTTAAGESVASEDSIVAKTGSIIAGHDGQSDTDELATPGHTGHLTQFESITPSEATGHDVEIVSTQISTELGGLFYLINLGLYLSLYGDFTTPAKPGLELIIWDFVELVGRELVGDDHADDPIWSLLRDLAGRPKGELPGENFGTEDEWRLPPDWLSPFGSDQPWQWSASRGRLRVFHPEGFAVLDLKLVNNPHQQLQRELEPYGIAFISISRARPGSKPLKSKTVRRRRLRRWLSLLMPYVRARLRVALGPGLDADIASTLCRRDARVDASAAHLDIHFGLADLPLQIRFAGLDRDPGWVPAAGRFITFHFG